MQAERTYNLLLDHYGPQDWWPADSCFEVMLGAVLTQNTAWRNVESAIAALRAAGLLDASALTRASDRRVARLIRPAGCFNVKTRRIKALCAWYLHSGGYQRLRRRSTAQLRGQLLAVHGVGPETADAILLYGFHRAVFVIDAYTRRLFARLGDIVGTEPYDALSARFAELFESRAKSLNELHALIVCHAKTVCRTTPRCARCCLAEHCRYALDAGIDGRSN